MKENLVNSLSHISSKLKIAWVSENGNFLIIAVNLVDYKALRLGIEKLDWADSVTSSGKIRLVKSKLSVLDDGTIKK